MRNGSASGLQRYKCRACRRIFNALSATLPARLRLKAKWLAQQDVLKQGLSVHKAAAELEVSPGVSLAASLLSTGPARQSCGAHQCG
ncbi:hypothetical protein DBR42_22090 [Pelomonas sp. HMWF004]|nr:hypothetical protein DBR42_22090 [Pelomonas sp. HMWF004]